MAEFLPEMIKKGDPPAKVPAEFFTKVDEVLSYLSVYNGYIEKTENFWQIVYLGDDPADGIIEGPKGNYHLKVTMGDDDTHIKVLGGSRIRDVAGVNTRTQLAGDGGLAPTVDLFKTETISSSVFVWVYLDDALIPTTLTVNTGAAYPVPDNDGEKLLLAFVTWDGAKITAIEQYWTGGDWRDEWIVTDGLSLGYNAAKKIEIAGWTGATGEAPVAADRFLFQDDTDDGTGYATGTQIAALIQSIWSGSPVAGITSWAGLTDTTGDPTDGGVDGYLPFVTGGSLVLTDLAASGAGPFWVKGATEADCYGEAIGNDALQKVIDLDLEQLNIAAGNVTLNWNAQQLLEGTGGTMTLDWLARQLDGADWSVLASTIFNVLNTTAAGDGVGSIVNSGGYSGLDGMHVAAATVAVAGVFLRGTREAYLCTAQSGGEFIETGSNNTVSLANASNAIDAVFGAINANATSGFAVGGIAGANQFSLPLTIADTDGGTHTLYLRGGILCAA